MVQQELDFGKKPLISSRAWARLMPSKGIESCGSKESAQFSAATQARSDQEVNIPFPKVSEINSCSEPVGPLYQTIKNNMHFFETYIRLPKNTNLKQEWIFPPATLVQWGSEQSPIHTRKT